MKQSQKYFLLLFITFFMFSCGEDETPQYPDLRIYLDRFEEEARLRGFDLDLSQVEAVYVDKINFGGGDFCGYGFFNYDGNGHRRIEIARSGSNCNWLNSSDIERETLVFHEIGHAFFNRVHEETRLCNGYPVTIMATQFGGIYKEGETKKRDYYISELLDRLVANGQCIKKEKDWFFNPVFYKGDIQDPNWKFVSTHQFYEGSRDNNNLLRVTGIPGGGEEDLGYWFRQFDAPNIPECADVTFKVTFNASLMEGPGASIAIRAFHNPFTRDGAITEQYLYLHTDDTPFTGEVDNYTKEITMPCFSRKTTFLIFFVSMLPGTAGEVSVKDVEVLVKEN